MKTEKTEFLQELYNDLIGQYDKEYDLSIGLKNKILDEIIIDNHKNKINFNYTKAFIDTIGVPNFDGKITIWKYLDASNSNTEYIDDKKNYQGQEDFISFPLNFQFEGKFYGIQVYRYTGQVLVNGEFEGFMCCFLTIDVY